MFKKNDSTSFLQRISESLPFLSGMVLSIVLAVAGSGWYLFTTSLPSPPFYFGLASVETVNGPDSFVLFENEKLPAEIITASQGDVVSIYSDNGRYTNNPTGHSDSSGSLEEVLILFGIIAIALAASGFFMGYAGTTVFLGRLG
jgi:hypothetical protein